MKLKKIEKCPVCSSKDIFYYKKGTIDHSKIKSSDFRITDSAYGSLWDFSKCNVCSFVFSNPQPDKESLNEFYSDLEDFEYSEESQGRSKNFTTVIKRLGKLDLPGNEILDVGSASGIFVKLATDAGYKCTGIEPSAYLVNEAKKKFGVEIFKGSVEDFKTKRKYSVITMLDIIEHVHSPADLISKVSSLLKPGGFAVIVTPDIDSMTAKLFGKRWWHYRIAHVNFFNLVSLKKLLTDNGLEIVLKKRYAWNFSLYYLFSRLIPSLKDRKSLQKILKKINLRVQLFDSLEVYARKI